MERDSAFFARNAVEVAFDLVGCTIVHGDVALRIVETEAYRTDDSACHAWRGRTARNAPLFGPPGSLYVYLCYGLHWMVNLVAEPEGVAAAVLLRGGVVLAGHDRVRARRGGRLDCLGPGKVGQALALEGGQSGLRLGLAVRVLAGEPPERIEAGPRVGIDYALPEHRALPWRFRDPSVVAR